MQLLLYPLHQNSMVLLLYYTYFQARFVFVQVCHHTVNKGLDVVVATQPCSGRCMDLLSEHAEDLHTLACPSVWKSAASVVWLWHRNLSAWSSWSASVTETTSSPTAFPAWHRAFVASWI